MSKGAQLLSREEIDSMDLTAVQDAREELLEEINAIDVQLGSDVPTAEDGTPIENPLSDAEYRNWRRRALEAKRHKMRTYRALKRRCNEIITRNAVDRTGVDADDAHQVVHVLSTLVHRLQSRGVRLERDEIDMVMLVDHYTANHPL